MTTLGVAPQAPPATSKISISFSGQSATSISIPKPAAPSFHPYEEEKKGGSNLKTLAPPISTNAESKKKKPSGQQASGSSSKAKVSKPQEEEDDNIYSRPKTLQPTSRRRQ
jgi:hypothetical protein